MTTAGWVKWAAGDSDADLGRGGGECDDRLTDREWRRESGDETGNADIIGVDEASEQCRGEKEDAPWCVGRLERRCSGRR